MVWAKKNEAAA